MTRVARKLWKFLGVEDRDRRVIRSMEALSRKKPRRFLELCRSLGIDKLSLRYLDAYAIDIDVGGGSIAEAILERGRYQYELMVQLAELVPLEKLLFVNIGANIGTTCLNAHSLKVERFVAVEPIGRNFAMLERNLSANGIAAEMHCCALGNRAAEIAINIHPTSGGRHSIKARFEGGQTATVQSRTLDSLGLLQKFVLWIDTEGFEYEVLEGGRHCIEAHCVAACVEITPQICGVDGAERTLTLLGDYFDRFYAADGQQLTVATLSERLAAGGVDQFDLIAVDSRKL